jgi:hypothetical protein
MAIAGLMVGSGNLLLHPRIIDFVDIMEREAILMEFLPYAGWTLASTSADMREGKSIVGLKFLKFPRQSILN